jgi:transcriptional regulator with XRE-family HTH domain
MMSISPNLHGYVSFLPPGVRITLRALKPKAYPENPRSVGEHVKKRRLETGLSQVALARLLRVCPFTVTGWEKGRLIPPTMTMARLIGWLGYDPLPQGESLAERLKARRRAMGWSQEEAARKFGVERSVFARWERGGRVHFRVYRRRLAQFLGLVKAKS